MRYNAVKTYFWQAPENSFGGVRFADRIQEAFRVWGISNVESLAVVCVESIQM